MRRGIATFTLDYGKCPPWLFRRMVALGREIVRVLVDEYGAAEFLKRIADPVWFQSLGMVLAFDWNASGLTTILTAALKEAIRGEEENLGVFICGGKGRTSLKTPDEILNWGERLNLEEKKLKDLSYSSKMAAKVDSSLVQDGYQIYHHAFFSSVKKTSRASSLIDSWAVVQQGMNTSNATARRYHWYDELEITNNKSQITNHKKDFVEEPHAGIASQVFKKNVLNLVDKKSRKNKEISRELAASSYNTLMKDIQLLRSHFSRYSKMISLRLRSGQASKKDEQLTFLKLNDPHFTTHPVVYEDFTKSKYLERILQRVTYEKPEDYESLLSIEGVGPKTIRALSLVSEIIYGAGPSYEDPARYSFAHGGKDAIPYSVDVKTYDNTINILEKAVKKSKINPFDKEKALRRLQSINI
ncbi:MAG: hypothetical protein A3B44_03155 [Candidatus Levybacteria bacterium RIFCSPLOWO2_01_FULL_38_21]|nr:MAG: hypothetical protein A3B44_03155 [Candidatus Levybacteria bacterium RIFCSPLOWO2_01_FULL_38_21]